MKAVIGLLAGATLASTLALTHPAAAQARSDTVEYSGPDRTMLRSGVFTLGLAYVPALIVGIESPRPEDRFLVAPVAGPWIDLANRDCASCPHETLDRVLLGVDGVIQGIGALDILGSFLFSEHAVVQRTASAEESQGFRMHLTTMHVSSGYGLKAIGQF